MNAWNNEKEVLESVRDVEQTTSDEFQGRRENGYLQRLLTIEDQCMTNLAQKLRDDM